jgi:hypothetical protein
MTFFEPPWAAIFNLSHEFLLHVEPTMFMGGSRSSVEFPAPWGVKPLKDNRPVVAS